MTRTALTAPPHPPSAVEIRRVRPTDAARTRAIRLEMLADSPLAFLETLAQAAARSHAEYQARIAEHSAGDRVAQFIAVADGRAVAHAGGTAIAEEPGVTVIFAVYVTPAWRGRGLIAGLTEAVAEWSRAAGRPNLMLEVVVGNDRAVRAYERVGFVDTGVRLPHPTTAAMTELQMRRRA